MGPDCRKRIAWMNILTVDEIIFRKKWNVGCIWKIWQNRLKSGHKDG